MNRNTIYAALFLFAILAMSAFVFIRSNAADDKMIERELSKPSTVTVGKYSVSFDDPATIASLNSATNLADILNIEGVQSVSWIEGDSGKYFLCEKKNTGNFAFTRTELPKPKE